METRHKRHPDHDEPAWWTWVLAPALAWAVIFPVGERDFLWPVGWVLAGALASAIQGPFVELLSEGSSSGRRWHAAGLVGWCLAGLIVALLPFSLPDGVALALTLAAVLPLGMAQAWVLRRSFRRALSWIAVPPTALFVALAGSLLLHQVAGLAPRASLPQAIAVGSVFGALYGAVEIAILVRWRGRATQSRGERKNGLIARAITISSMQPMTLYQR